MVKFGELSEKEKQDFTEEIQKSTGNSMVEENKMELWPEDDETMVKDFFKH